MEHLEKSEHHFTFDDGIKDKHILVDKDGNETDGPDVAEIKTVKNGGKYTPKFEEKSRDGANLSKDGTPGKGSGGTICWSASQGKKTEDGEYDPKTILAHEAQHAVDAEAGLRDPSLDENGVPRKETKAVRRQHDSLQRRDPDAPLRETYDGKKVENHDVALPISESIPEDES